MSKETAVKPMTHKEIMFVLSGLMMGMLLAALDQTIVSTALKKIVEDLDRKSTRLNSSHSQQSRMPSSA